MHLQTLRYILEPDSAHQQQEGVDEEISWAEALNEGFTARVQMPGNATLLPTVEFSSKGITVYAIASPDEAENIEREFFVVGNGRNLPDWIGDPEQARDGYVGTAKVVGGPTAHVFELVKATA